MQLILEANNIYLSTMHFSELKRSRKELICNFAYFGKRVVYWTLDLPIFCHFVFLADIEIPT